MALSFGLVESLAAAAVLAPKTDLFWSLAAELFVAPAALAVRRATIGPVRVVESLGAQPSPVS